jgi:membrane-associated phospholipid phosphatase
MSYPILNKLFLTFILSAILVVVCYYTVDKPVALWFYQHHFQSIGEIKKATYIVDNLLALSLLGVGYGLYKRQFQLAIILFVLFMTVIVAIKASHGLKFVFARIEPNAWLRYHKQGLDIYGYYFFNHTYLLQAFKAGTQEFPSGHSTAICAATAFLWHLLPKFRLLYVAVCATVIACLVMMQYHFVGSCIAGAYVGALMGLGSYHLFRRASELV